MNKVSTKTLEENLNNLKFGVQDRWSSALITLVEAELMERKVYNRK